MFSFNFAVFLFVCSYLRLELFEEVLRVIWITAIVYNTDIEFILISSDRVDTKMTHSLQVIRFSFALAQITCNIFLNVTIISSFNLRYKFRWLIDGVFVEISSIVYWWKSCSHLEKLCELLSITCRIGILSYVLLFNKLLVFRCVFSHWGSQVLLLLGMWVLLLGVMAVYVRHDDLWRSARVLLWWLEHVFIG